MMWRLLRQNWLLWLSALLCLLVAIAFPKSPATATETATTSAPELVLTSSSHNHDEELLLTSEFLAPDLRDILERGELIVAMRGLDTPPFIMTDDRNGDRCPALASLSILEADDRRLCGIDVEIAIGLARALGVKLRVDRSQSDFNDVVNLVYHGQADLAISKLSWSLNRAARLRFSQPYLRMRQSLLVNRLQLEKAARDRDKVEVIQTLAGQKVGVIKDTQYSLFAKRLFPDASIVEFPTWEMVLEAVNEGTIVAAFRDEMEVKKVVMDDPKASLALQTVAFTDTQDLIAAILPWNKPQLLSFVNGYLTLEQLDFTADEILDKYVTDGKS